MSIATLHQQPGSSTGVAGRCEKARCFLGPRWLGVGRPAWRCFEALLSALATIPVSPPPVAHSVPVTLTLARTAVHSGYRTTSACELRVLSVRTRDPSLR